ncbi:serine hydrolase domain-containing protein [Rhodohalobacter sulfatireducens]|uniref:Beta-lactamase family protein n=1 Tax=Rhodohalobacter sulfatireducens TaxID=2911366 RepID=A0ABS9KCU3_9BACT|nr:serine hydrolase domain-containing protein [Rhodohalobacter sulfatireducens]MCG2588638.1 beta-lactamase family protein [Rhodohalobacter sulfatireducens]
MKFIFTLIFILLSSGVFAQTESQLYTPPLSEGIAEDVGMSDERLSRIDEMILNAIDQNQIPGAAALVARDGEIVYKKAFGLADNEAGRELRTDTIFRIASQTKAITSTAVMMLWEHGLFQLDDPISDYLPVFGEAQILDTFNADDTTYTTVPAENQITIRDLLTHTSGIGYGVIDGDERFKMIYEKAGVTDLFTTEDITIEESVTKLAKLPLHHEPGEEYTYSEGLDVLGYFVEEVSGMPFDEYLRTHLFDPLGMDDTWFYLPESKHDRLVTVQRKDENGNWESYPVTFYDPDYPREGAMTFFSGGAGLSSTIEDYAKFLQMYLNNGEYAGTRLLSRTTVNFMMQNQVGDLRGDSGRDYGLAFGLVDEKGEAMGGRGSFGTFDWGGYFNTQYFADPNENVIGLIFKQTQGNTGDETGWKFRQLVFQSIDD